ncbi:unnamed protein product [Dicrocoelium dendriticum]|nr:unnamed protein product [Dicrocoelium dendriticum]
MQSNGYHNSHYFLISRASESETCQDGLKSDEVAHNHRNKSLASRGEMLIKLDSSTEAIIAANTTGCRSMGYDCRSQLLQSLAAIEAELDDLTRCFENDPPVAERRSLLHRCGIALRKLGQFHEAHAAFLEAKFAARFRCSEDVPESVLSQNLRQCDNQDSSDRNMHPPLIFHSKPWTGFQITENISFTDCISQEPGSFRVRSNGLLGWNLVANRDIIPGELIAAETPYVRVPDPGKELRHCYHCCKRSLSLIPCRNCSEGQMDNSNKKAAHSGNSVRPRSSLFAFSGHETVPAAVVRTDFWQRIVAAVFLAHCLSAGGYPLDWEDDPMLTPSHALTGDDRSTLPASWAAACLLYHLQADMCATRCQTVVCREQDAVNSS